jgi:hypothetical protein|tara:strand:+ start:9122 stop:9313 length:192 start_codon:yes stop_codon:yes gene_type:complete
MAKIKKPSTMETALAKAVATMEDNTGEVVSEPAQELSGRVKRLLARKKTLQRQRKNHLPQSLK